MSRGDDNFDRYVVRTSFPGLCMVAILATGCATTEPTKAEQASSATRIYSEPHERVYAAVLAAAKSEQLAVVETERKSGRVILANRLNSMGWVETITVAVSRASAGSSQVTIFSRQPAPTHDLPPNWGRIINDRFGEFREAPSQRGNVTVAWGQILLARVGAELAETGRAPPAD